MYLQDKDVQDKSRDKRKMCLVLIICSGILAWVLVIIIAALFSTGVIGEKRKGKADRAIAVIMQMMEKLELEIPIVEPQESENSLESKEDMPKEDMSEENMPKEIDWRQSYIDAIETGKIYGYNMDYALNDVNSDGVPELFVHAGSHADYMAYVRKDGSIDGMGAALGYNNGLLYVYIDLYDSGVKETISVGVYSYDQNSDGYRIVEGKNLKEDMRVTVPGEEWDGSWDETKYYIDEVEVTEQEYNVRLAEINGMDWNDGFESEYDGRHYGYRKEDIIRAINEYQPSSGELGQDTGGDYLCADSSTRILTEEDINKLKSGIYNDLPKGKEIIQMVVNEIYARKGYSFKNTDIQAYFEEKEWYRNITQRSMDQESIFQNMSDIEKYNVEFLSSFN